jgi:hypothetical protein
MKKRAFALAAVLPLLASVSWTLTRAQPAGARQMRWIRQAGVGVIVYSWWGQGSYEDQHVVGIMSVAAQYGIKVAFHIEPYSGRNAASVVSDVNYIDSTYGGSPAFYRDPQHGNKPVFYVFDSPPTWVTITSFNEWHEGSQIEPATSTPPSGYGYLTFDGAYGQTGAAAETAYLNRTAYWVNRFESLLGTS